MPFIGNQPTAVPLTSADLEDNIISTAKIQDNAVTTAKTSYSDAPYRNIIINGDMSIAQRGTSQATAGSAGGSYQVQDRWKFYNNNQGAFTWSQDTDVPTEQGFAKSLKLDCTTADASPAASDYLILEQSFEGQNLQYLKKGTASAQSLTLSFWVKSVKTGTYIAGLFDSDNTRQISKSYTINSASTWEYKSVTFAGDTTGTLNNDNGKSLVALFFLGGGTDITSGTLATSWESYTGANRAVGQVNLADDTANNFWITGVQLEEGTTASDFEFLPVDVNKNRCKRYFQKTTVGAGRFQGSWVGLHWSGSVHIGSWSVETEFRADPTISYGGSFALLANGVDGYGYTPSGGYQHSYGSVVLNMNGTARATSHAVVAYSDNANTFLSFDAEL